MVKAPTIFKCFGSALQKAPVAQCSLGLRVTLARSQLLSAHKGIHLIATGIFSPCCAALEVVWQAGLAVLPAQGPQLHLTAGSVIHVLSNSAWYSAGFALLSVSLTYFGHLLLDFQGP